MTTIMLRTNMVMIPNRRISTQRLSKGEQQNLCIHNGAANVIISVLTITYFFLRAISFLIIPETN